MGDFKVKICRLCLNVIENDVFEIINEVPKNLFDVLLLKLCLDDDTKHLMCSACSAKLYAAFHFKSKCLVNQVKIGPGMVDLRETCLKEKRNEGSKDESSNREICQLCANLICEFTPLAKADVNEIKRYIPELNFDTFKNPVVCQSCLQSLTTHSGFIKDFLDKDKNGNSYFKVKDGVSKHEELSSDWCVKPVKDAQNEGERSTERVLCLKSEGIEIKPEVDEQLEERYIKSEVCWVKQEINEETVDFHDNFEVSNQAGRTDPCENSTERGKLKKASNVHKCTSCDYKATQKSHLDKHMLVHKDPSEIEWHECNLCDYKTKYKAHLKPHMLVHKSPSEIEWFRCGSCNYKAKRKKLLTTHLLSHKPPLDVQWHQCGSCDYKASQKSLLTKHSLIHTQSKTQWHECESCNYKTKQEQLLEWHVLKHKSSSEQPWFECDVCGFKVKYKRSWERHKLTHQDPSEAKWYHCDSCDHKTKWKDSLKLHMVKHKSDSQIQWYKCDLCDFKVKHKRSWERHKLVHKSPSEILWYECNSCDYKAKQKANLERHTWLTHKLSNGIA